MDNDIYKDGWNNINSYIFGWIMSDGCLRKEGRNKTSYAVRITSNDKDIIEWLHSQLCIGNKIYKVGEKGFQVKYRNKESIEFMRDNGLKERKSLDMSLPNIPNEYFGDFLRGYFDGNGSVVLRYTQYNTYAQISFTSGSSQFVDGLQDKLFTLGIKSHVYKDGRINNSSYYLKVIKRSEIEELFKVMYQTSNQESRLKRKYEKYKLYLDCKPKYKIVKPYDIV